MSIVVNGLLAGTIYALIALAFVVVYKSSRMINFAVGEWVMFGSLLVAAGLHILALGLVLSIVLAVVGMIALASAFGHLVLRRLAGSSAGFHHHDHTWPWRSDAGCGCDRLSARSQRDIAAAAVRTTDRSGCDRAAGQTDRGLCRRIVHSHRRLVLPGEPDRTWRCAPSRTINRLPCRPGSTCNAISR